MDKWRYVENDSCSSFHFLDPTQVPAQTDRVGPDGLLAPVQDTMWYLCSKLGTSIIHQKHLRAKNSENIQKLSSHSRVLLRLFECCFWYTYIYIYVYIFFTFIHLWGGKLGKLMDHSTTLTTTEASPKGGEILWFDGPGLQNQWKGAVLKILGCFGWKQKTCCYPRGFLAIFDFPRTRRESRRKWGQLAIANGNCTLQCQATRACSR